MLHSSQAIQRRAFHIHAFAFVFTMVFLTALNLYLGAPYWIAWTFLGWGIGILSHWWFVLGPGSAAGK